MNVSGAFGRFLLVLLEEAAQGAAVALGAAGVSWLVERADLEAERRANDSAARFNDLQCELGLLELERVKAELKAAKMENKKRKKRKNVK